MRDQQPRQWSITTKPIHFVQICVPCDGHLHPHHRLVLLLHGWMGHFQDMVSLGNRLARDGYRVIIPDLPFHGKSVDCRPRSLREAALLLVKALADIFAVDQGSHYPLIIGGYSLGGRLALEIADDLSRRSLRCFRLQALLLISSAPPPMNDKERRERAADGERIATRLQTVKSSMDFGDWLLNSWYASPMWHHFPDTDRFTYMLTHRHITFDSHKTAWTEAALYMARYPGPNSATLDVLDVPTLYVHGDCDEKYAAFSTRMGKLFVNFSTEAVIGSGHNVIMQKPAECNHSISQFLEANFRPSTSDDTVKILAVRILRYSLPLKNPMKVNGINVHQRDGMLLALSSDDNGVTGVGDICPLPGLHTQNIEKCLTEVQCLSHVLHVTPGLFGHQCCVLLNMDMTLRTMSPVIKNAFTSAALHLLSQFKKISLKSLIRHLMVACSIDQTFLERPCRSLPLNGVLPRSILNVDVTSHSQCKERLVNFMEQSPFQTLKVKVGVTEEAIKEGEILKATVLEAEKKGRIVRLDANRAWTKEQFDAIRSCLGTQSSKIDFLEEPFRESSELEAYLLDSDTGPRIRVGLDESISDCNLREIASLANSADCGALVVKPAVIGLLRDIFKLREIAASSNSRVVMSSVFESGVGLAWAAVLAAVCQTEETSHGLGTFTHLCKDVIVPGFSDSCFLESSSLCIDGCARFLSFAAHNVVMKGTLM